MDDLRNRRRALTAQAPAPAPSELYPVGTDLMETYLKPLTGNRDFDSSGLVVSGSHFCSVSYAPIDPDYTYKKNAILLRQVHFYDENKTYLSSSSTTAYYSTTVQTITIPKKARFLRVMCMNNNAAQNLTITRTA